MMDKQTTRVTVYFFGGTASATESRRGVCKKFAQFTVVSSQTHEIMVYELLYDLDCPNTSE